MVSDFLKANDEYKTEDNATHAVMKFAPMESLSAMSAVERRVRHTGYRVLPAGCPR